MAELLDHWAALASSAVRASRNRLRTVSPSWRASAASRASRSARRATCSFVAALRPATSPSPTRQTDTAAPGPRRPPRPWQYRRPRRSAVRGRCSHARAGARAAPANATAIEFGTAAGSNTAPGRHRGRWFATTALQGDHRQPSRPRALPRPPPTLPSAPSGAPPILRRMMASAASCRNDCSHYRRAVRVARGPVNPGAPLPQGAGTVPSSPRSALRPVAGRASVAARVGRYAGGPPTGTGAGASRSMAPERGKRISALSGGAPSQSNSNLWRVSEMI